MNHVRADDGARLAYHDEGQGLPVLALAGLTRTMRDFDYLGAHLAGHSDGVRLIRLDSRGRGGSDWTGADTYTVPREARDALCLIDHLGLDRVAILGSSRGGLIGLFLAATAPDRLRGLCLNDIGPVLERDALERIGEYVGIPPFAKTRAQMAERLASAMPGFVDVPAARWAEEAERLSVETVEGLGLTYDPALRTAFLDAIAAPPVDLWPLFDACAGFPLALLRGENSDLLSVATVEAMRARRPDLLFASVANRGHIPFLDEPESLDLIHHWIAAMR